MNGQENQKNKFYIGKTKPIILNLQMIFSNQQETFEMKKKNITVIDKTKLLGVGISNDPK